MSRPAILLDPLPTALTALGIVVAAQAANAWSPLLGFGLVALPVLLSLVLAAALVRPTKSRQPPGQDTLDVVASSHSESEDRALVVSGVRDNSVILGEHAVEPSSQMLVAWDAEQADGDGGKVLQDWSRRIDPAGLETLSGKFRIEYVEGSRTAVAHIPWLPAFSGLPDVSLEPVEGDEAEVRIEELRSWGMRLSARRSESLAGFTLVEFHVQSLQNLRRAA